MKAHKKLRHDLEELQIRLPCPWPVTLRFGKINPDSAAEMHEKKDHLEILIDGKIGNYPYLCDLLIHEYAHCRDFLPGRAKWMRRPHDSIWAIRWAEVHREFYGVR